MPPPALLGPGCSSLPGEPGPARLLWGLRSPVGSPVPAQEDTTSPLAVLEELASGDCRQDLATKLVKLFLGRDLAGPFLDYLTRREVARTSEFPTQTLFSEDGAAEDLQGEVRSFRGCLYVGVSMPSTREGREHRSSIRCCVASGSLPNFSGPLAMIKVDVLRPKESYLHFE